MAVMRTSAARRNEKQGHRDMDHNDTDHQDHGIGGLR
jgi:hypothetical protein